MRKEKIYSLSSLYRENMDIYGYRFGKGEKAACIVGAMRGNEIQQMYIGCLLYTSVACSSGRPALGTDPGGLKQHDRIP